MITALRQFLKDLQAVWGWLLSFVSRPLLRALERVLTVDKTWGLRRGVVRDLMVFGIVGWILFDHWGIVSNTGILIVWGKVQGSTLARLIGVAFLALPRYVLKLAMVFLLPESMRVWLLAILPYFLAKYVATRYVEDIYEVSDALRDREEGLEVANEFLLRAAFADGYGRVKEKKTWGCRLLWKLRPLVCPTEEECLRWGRSRQYGVRVPLWRHFIDFLRGKPLGCPHTLAIIGGEVKDRRSPLLLVGGPGYVFISADSAAFFERPDGTGQVVPPTRKRLYLMRGFERLRRVVSLQEHKMSVTIHTRSRDGIPIEVQDVELLFSLYRGRRPPTPDNPYPFSESALRRLVYSEMASPLTDRWEALASSRLLTNTMRSAARSTLSTFIRSQTVVEFLASVSPSDWDTLEATYRQIAQDLQPPQNGVGPALSPPPHPAAPAFVPRPKIAERFQAFLNSEQGRNARLKGVGLEWIGLGAWHTPVAKVIDQHLDAWRLSIANVLRSSPVVLQQLEHQRRTSAFVEYVRELLAWFQNTQGESTRQRQYALLKYILERLEFAALTRYGGMSHAPASWRRAGRYLRGLVPHDVDRADNVS